jgi:hypothetical protein
MIGKRQEFKRCSLDISIGATFNAVLIAIETGLPFKIGNFSIDPALQSFDFLDFLINIDHIGLEHLKQFWHFWQFEP